MPLHVVAYSDKGYVESYALHTAEPTGFTADEMDALGPGKRSKKARHKARRKRMGNHKNMSDRANGGIFGKGKKKDGAGQNILFLIVPAVAVAGLAVLFVTNTNQKNSEPVPDPTGTN